MSKCAKLLSWGKKTHGLHLIFPLMNVLSLFHDPLSLKILLKLKCMISENTVHESLRVNKQEFSIPRPVF